MFGPCSANLPYPGGVAPPAGAAPPAAGAGAAPPAAGTAPPVGTPLSRFFNHSGIFPDV